jgi:undecaprenyl pyrophosphate phosphatase UppP
MLEDLTVKHGLGFGFAQALALIPGVRGPAARPALARS